MPRLQSIQECKPGAERLSAIDPNPPKEGVVGGRELVVTVEAIDAIADDVAEDDTGGNPR